MTFDLLIKGATVIDPSQRLNTAMDLALKEGVICALAPDLAPASAERTIDGSGLILTPGLIDLHTHVYSSRSLVLAKAAVGGECWVDAIN